MLKKVFVAVIIIAIILIGIILIYSKIKTNDDYSSIMDAMFSGEKLKCIYSISENGETSKAMVLVEGMKFNHTEYFPNGNSREVFDGNTHYNWSENAKRGFYLNKDCLKDAGIKIEEEAIPEAYSFEDDRIHCEPIDSVELSVPKDIEFKDACESFLKTLNKEDD